MEQYANGPVTTLDGAIDDTVTSIDVIDASLFPATGNFRIRIDDELLLVTGVAGNTFTVTREVEDSVAASHSDGASVTNVLTAQALLNLLEGNAATATALATGRAIYGNNFDGTAALTQIIASTYGGTGSGFTKFSGPASTEKTFTLPNATATILTDNAVVTGAQGGTGVANTGKTITIGGNFVTSGAFGTTLTVTNTTNVTLPTTGTLATLAGAESLTNKKLGSLTTNGFVKTSSSDGTLSVDTNTYLTTSSASSTYQPLDAALTALAAGSDFVQFTGPTTSTKTFTLPNATATILTSNAVVTGAQGGTGVANTSKTITLGGNFVTSGAFATTLTSTNTTNVTLPTTGTLATLAGAESLTNKKLGSLTTNGFVKTSSSDGTLSVDTTTYQTSDATLTALASYNTNGVICQTAADTFAGRTITGTASQITVTNGDGVSGNPTISLPNVVTIGATATADVTFNLGSNGGSTYFAFKETSTDGRHYLIGSTGTPNGQGPGKLVFFDLTGGTQRFAVHPSGNISIGAEVDYTMSAPARMTIRNVSEQLRLEYDVGNYVSFTTNSSGQTTIASSGNVLTLSDRVVTNKVTHPLTDDGNSSTAKTIDWTTGNRHKLTLTGSPCVLTFTAPASDAVLYLKLSQDGSTRLVTWPASVKWPGGVAPTLSTGGSKIDIITLVYDATAGHYYAQAAMDFS